jgi:addiction module RelE/StbE family toxin
MLHLLITPQFEKDVRKIPKHILNEADYVILLLRKNPVNPFLRPRKLKGISPSVWRVRINAYRLIYSFNKTSLILLNIRHRKDIYR